MVDLRFLRRWALWWRGRSWPLESLIRPRWFVVVAVLFACNAQAQIPMQQSYRHSMSSTLSYASPELACRGMQTWASEFFPANIGGTGAFVRAGAGSESGSCYWQGSNGEVGANSWSLRPGLSCPANSVQIGATNTCGCLQGFQQAGNACVPAKSELESFCDNHSKNKSTWPQTGTIGSTSSTPEASCFMPDPPFPGADANKGCRMTLTDQVKAPKENDPLLHQWSATGKMTGETCGDAPATDAEPKAEDDKCPGGFAGTVNGVEKCIPAEPNKGIEGVKTGSTTDADGTKHDTKETTKCEGTVCTTTKTTKTTSTNGTITNSTSSVTESLADKCAKDPANSVCKKTNGGQGATGTPDGCAANSSGEGCGGDPAGIGDLYTGKEETVSGILTQASNDLKGSPIGSAMSGFFTINAGGSCPAIVWNIPYLNATATLPNLCSEIAANLFAVMRGVLLLVASFLAFRIAVDN